jgi:hypothetical protein
MSAQFSDSIDNNLDMLRALLGDCSPSELRRAQKAAGEIEKVVLQLRKDNPQDSAVGVGVAFAVHMIAQRLTQNATPSEERGSIILLN